MPSLGEEGAFDRLVKGRDRLGVGQRFFAVFPTKTHDLESK
jgi:hypothetical protein